jgi:hypothetical protein
MAFDFLEPISSELLEFVQNASSQAIGSKIVLHTHSEFPRLDTIKIAIVGVLDNRGQDDSIEVNITNIRKELYSLFPGNWQAIVADLGDIPKGETQKDTYYAVSKIVAELVKDYSNNYWRFTRSNICYV